MVRLTASGCANATLSVGVLLWRTPRAASRLLDIPSLSPSAGDASSSGPEEVVTFSVVWPGTSVVGALSTVCFSGFYRHKYVGEMGQIVML